MTMESYPDLPEEEAVAKPGQPTQKRNPVYQTRYYRPSANSSARKVKTYRRVNHYRTRKNQRVSSSYRRNSTGANFAPSLNEVAGRVKLAGTGEFPLFEELYQIETLKEAFRQLRQGRSESARKFRGTADHISIELYEHNLEANLSRLRWKLQSGNYRPHPVNQFRLPKPGGGERALAVFTVEDRIIQRAILRVLEPVFEPHFLPCSYAFRPDRSIRTALTQVEAYYAEGYRWTVDADIESFFDRILVPILMDLLAARVDDRRLLALISLVLNYTPLLNPLPAVRHNPASSPQPRITVEPVEPPEQAGRKNQFSELTRRMVENGLDWGMERLEGVSGSGNYYYRQSAYYYRPSSPTSSSSYGPANSARLNSNLEDEDEETNFASNSYSSSSLEEASLGREVWRRLATEGSWLGLSLAKKAVKHGLPHLALPGGLGFVLKAGATVGIAGAAGTWAVRKWRSRPTLYKLETANYLHSAASPQSGERLPFSAGTAYERQGIAQGSVLSPFFSNVYLHEFDRRLTENGYKLVRFADDLVIMCRTQREAFEALELAEQILQDLGLNFKPAKTRVCPLGEGFTFLGARFGANGKWKELPDEPRLPAFPGRPDQPVATGWLSRARKGWLGKTVRVKPGTVQRSKPNKPG
jgi:retron-type reverse transcriptase